MGAKETECNIPLLQQKQDNEYGAEDDNENNSENKSDQSSESSKIEKVYKRRWFILFIFSMNTMACGVLFVGLSPIANIAAKHYNTSEVLIEWLSNSFLFLYVILALPACYLMFKYGVRATLTTIAAFNALATLLHYFAYEGDRFWLIVIGYSFAAIAFSGILQIPGQLSAKWFPEDERATATSIGVFMNIFGIAIGYQQATHYVKDNMVETKTTEELRILFSIQMAVVVLVFILTLFGYRENPPSPPSFITAIPRFSFREDLLALFYDKNFFFMSQSYGIYNGLMFTFMIILNSLVTKSYPSGFVSRIGWMGFTAYMAGILSMFLTGLTLDRFKLHKKVAVALNLLSTITWLAFVLVLTQTKNFVALFILYGVLGSVAIPYASSGIEQAAEMTFPVPEIVSSTVILILANLYGFLIILIMSYLVNLGYVQTVGFLMFSFYILSTVFAYFAKTDLKRQEAEKEATSENSGILENLDKLVEQKF